MASELGDEDDVVAGADEAGQASVAQGVEQSPGLLDAQRPRGGLGEVFAADLGGAEPEEAVEVVEGGEGEIDRGRLGVAVGDEVAAVVADGVVPRVGVGERVALLAPEAGVALGEPGKLAADPAGVGAAGVRGQPAAIAGNKVKSDK